MHREIQLLESKYRISNETGRDEELNFGLVEVVYQWASNKVRVYKICGLDRSKYNFLLAFC